MRSWRPWEKAAKDGKLTDFKHAQHLSDLHKGPVTHMLKMVFVAPWVTRITPELYALIRLLFIWRVDAVSEKSLPR